MKTPEEEDRTAAPSFPQWEEWICPHCRTSHVGWSSINICSRCGYRESVQ